MTVRCLTWPVISAFCAALFAGRAAQALVRSAAVAGRFKPPHLLALPPAFPAGLQQDAPYASVHVRWTITVAGAAADCVSLTQSANLVALDATLRWLADPATHFQPAQRDGIVSPASHEMFVSFSYSPKHIPPHGSSVSEWPNPFPFFPATYAEKRRSGEVTCHFTVGPDGLPKDVQLDSVTGGAAFGTSVLLWLRSGSVHYRPNFSQDVPILTQYHEQSFHFK